MARTAANRDDAVYDESGSTPSRPQLHALEGGGQTSPPTGDLRAAPDPEPDIKAQEQDPDRHLHAAPTHPNQVGRGWRPGGKSWIGRQKRKFVIGGVVSLVMAGFSIFIFLALLPFKIPTMLQDLEKHFYATSQNAVTKEVDSLFSGYLKRAVLPGLNNCARSSTISKDCQALTVEGGDPVSTLYRAWKNNKLETTLADKYGTTFRYDAKSKRYFIKSPYLSEEVGFAHYDAKTKSVFLDAPNFETAVEREVKPSEFAKFLSGFHANMDDATQFTKVMYRFKMNGLLTKYGGWSRCIIACELQQQFKESRLLKKQAAKIKIAQRVVSPMSEQLSLVLECLWSNCDLSYKTDGSVSGLNGEPRSPAEQKLYDQVSELATTAEGQTTLEAVSQSVKDIREKGWTKYAMGKAFAKAVGFLGGSEEQKLAAQELSEKVLGPIGWALFGSALVSGLNNANGVVKELGYTMNASAYAQMYITYRTYADEIKSGNVDATEVGSFSDSLGPGAQCDDGGGLKNGKCSNGEAQLGGTAEAEQTPLYNALISGAPAGTSSANIFGNVALAASDSSSYLCKNGQPPPKGKLVCSEEVLGQGNQALQNVHNFLNQPGISTLTNMASIINGIGTEALKPLTWTLSGFFSLPPISTIWDKLQPLAQGLLQPAFQSLAGRLIDIPVSTNMSGGRTFDAVAGGTDVTGNDFAHHQLGGVELTSQQVADIQNQQNQEDLQNYQHQPLIARLFDKNSSYSLVTKLAMALPDNKQGALQSIGSIFSNPFSKIGSIFASLFSFTHAYAASAAQPDPFGITQYGYPNDDPVFSSDPQTYWQQHCTDNTYTNAWNSSSASFINPDTMQPENPQQTVAGLSGSDPKGTDPCLLIQTAVGSAGSLFDSSLLGTDGSGGGGSGGGGGGGGSGQFTNPFPNGWSPGRLDMGYDGHFQTQIVSPCDGTMVYVDADASHGYNGGWEGAFIAVKCSQDTGLPSSVFYFAEGLSPTVTQGQTVTAGQQIAVPGWTGYTEGPGGIEWGLADPSNPATVTLAESGTNGYSVAGCDPSKEATSGPSTPMVLGFAKWVQQNLGVAAPASPDHAGCP